MQQPQQSDLRIAKRFDKAFQVSVYSEIFGKMVAIARNISEGGIGLEMQEPLPMGSVVVIQFSMPSDLVEVSVRAEVKHHYCFNYNVGEDAASTRGIGLRFLEFLEDSEEHIPQSYTRNRVIH